MTVYAVFKEGIYRHECAGVFSTEERARTVADTCLAAGDGYHEFAVVPFQIDADVTLAYGDNITEPDDTYRAKAPPVAWHVWKGRA